MSGRLEVKSQCVGGDGCPLGLPSHPRADRDYNKSRYPLGCSLCRSEKIALVAENANAGAGLNLERRGSMLMRFGGVHGHDIGREMNVVRGAEAPLEPW